MKNIDISTKTHPNTFTFVDDVDFKELNRVKWHCAKGYAVRRRPKIDGGGLIYMHRVIMNTPKRLDTDHGDENKLNNQRYNLRVCTRSQNQQNRGKQENNTSGFKGVSWYKRSSKWQAHIWNKGRNKNLGLFFCLIKAAKAYDTAAREYFGEFANLNFKETQNE